MHTVLHIPICTHQKLIVYVMYREVTFANNLMDFITGFNITVETIKEIFPELSYKLDNLFYDAKSYAEAYLSKSPWWLHTIGTTRLQGFPPNKVQNWNCMGTYWLLTEPISLMFIYQGIIIQNHASHKAHPVI